MTTEFKISVTVDCPPEEAFDFLLRPENIVRISPPEIGLNFTNAPEVLELGSVMEFSVLTHGQVQRLTHKITHFESPLRFVEEQVEGPFKHWVHEHIFAVADNGTVTVTDSIEFNPPGGLIGLLVTESKILESLDDGFAHRHEQLQKLLNGN